MARLHFKDRREEIRTAQARHFDIADHDVEILARDPRERFVRRDLAVCVVSTGQSFEKEVDDGTIVVDH